MPDAIDSILNSIMSDDGPLTAEDMADVVQFKAAMERGAEMVRMSKYPKDIMEAAHKAATDAFGDLFDKDLDVEIFATPILAERERCAKIADAEADEDAAIYMASNHNDGAAADRIYAGKRIAMRIRGEA